MARLPQVGGDQGNWGEILNDFLLTKHNPDGTLNITKNDVGLSNVDNTSDANKPVSIAVTAALNAKANTSTLSPVATSGSYTDLINKPIFSGINTGDQSLSLSGMNLSISGGNTVVLPGGSGSTSWGLISGTITDQLDLVAALNDRLLATEKGAANGVATLDGNSHVPLSQLGTGTASSTTYLRGDGTWQTPSTGSGTVTSSQITDATTVGKAVLTSTDAAAVRSSIGLANVDNTSDASKPISNAQQAALDAKAPLASPTFTGAVTVPSPTNPTDATTKNYVDTQISAGTVDATSSAKGVIQLAGDLGGTASNPTVSKVNGTAITGNPSGANQVLTSIDTTSAGWASLPTAPVTSVAGKTGTVNLTSSDVGLENVDNTSDATKNSAIATLSNKTIDNTNTVNLKAANFTLKDGTDSTKVATFSVANLPTGTSNLYPLPNGNSTLLNQLSTQTISSKTLDNTNSIVIKASNLTIQDPTDTTKQIRFDVNTIGTGTTQTPQFPNSSAQLVNVSSTQTISGKTLSSPVVNTPLIQYPTGSITSSTTLVTANRTTIYTVDATSGSFTITLPNTTNAGYQFYFKRLDYTSNTVTITTATSPVFDGGLTTLQLTDRNQFVEVTTTTTSGTYYTTRNSVGVLGGKNLIQNGSFENGITNFGVANGATIASDTTIFRTGTKSAQVTHATTTQDNGIRLVNYSSGVLPVNTPYVVQAWVYLPSGSAPSGVRLSVQGTGLVGGTAYSTSYASVTNTWVRLQVNFVTAATAGTIQIYSIANNTTAGQIHNVDDVSLQEGSTPTAYVASSDDMVDLTTTQSISGAKTFSGTVSMANTLYFGNGVNIGLSLTSGTSFGNATNQKLSFYGVTPITQQAATVELGTLLSTLGLRATGSTYSLNTSGAATVGNFTSANLKSTGSFEIGYALNTSSATMTLSSPPVQICDATSGAITITLVSTTFSGIQFTIKKVDSSANTVTVSGGTIDGASSVVLSSQYKYVTLVSTTTAGVWYMIGSN